jgi:hypothetical protein
VLPINSVVSPLESNMVEEEPRTISPTDPYPRKELGTVSREQAIRVLDFIFHGYTQGFVEFRHLGSGRRPKIVGKPIFVPLPLDDTQITDQIMLGSDASIVSVGPLPRYRVPHGSKVGKDHDVLQAGCIWADLSYDSAVGGAIGVSRLIRDFPLRPSVTVNSGYGRQVYFALDQPFTDGRLLDWNDLSKCLYESLYRTDVVDLSRTVPLPGTLNLENPQNVLQCHLDEVDSSWAHYSFDELKEAVHNAREIKQVKSSGSQLGVAPESALPATMQERGVPQEVINAIITGRLSRHDERPFVESRDYHERDLWISTALLDRGFDKEEVKSIFRSNPAGCGSKFAREKNGERYLELTVRTALTLRRRKGHSDAGADDESYDLPIGYELDRDGSLWFKPSALGGERKTPKPVQVSNSYIGIAGIRENIDTGQISLVLEYNYLGQRRRRTILRSQMADARQLVSALADEGAPITTNNARHVTSYLAAYEHAFGAHLPRTKITSRFGRGRRDGPFLLPGVESGVEFSPKGEGDASLYRAYSSRRGTLQGWLECARTIASEGLMIPQIAILTSFVPPLQSRLQIPNFILDIHGGTSTGKSTALKLAASVYGSSADPDSLIMQWMNTKVAVEQLACVCSELPIFLDDAQHCPDELKRASVYMIANGRGKGRAARGGGIGEVPTWHTVALSTSEEPLHEASPHEGARGRILPLGGLVHPFPPGSGALVQALDRSALLNHGYAGEAYVRHLNNLSATDWTGLKRRYMEIRKEFLTGGASNVMDRVGGYIAAIQLGAEIACPLIRLPFKPEMVGTWLLLHLIEEQGRQNHVLLALRSLADYFIKHGSSFSGHERYDPARKVALYGAVLQGKYVAFLRNTFDDACRRHKWNPTAVLNKLADAGALVTTEDDRHTKRVSVGRVKHRMICVKWSSLFPEDYLTITTEGGRVLRRLPPDDGDETTDVGRPG